MHLPASKEGGNVGGNGREAAEIASRKGLATGDHGGALSPSSSSPPKSTALEKPQKVLPCPRCESMNTKFCYYNNYSVNQPRHFCRQCQRYWTVGGTLRNVPVGGGSRKKHRHPGQTHQQQQHLRVGEPYLRPGPLALATTPGQLAPPLATFPHDLNGFHLSQLPGLVPQTHPLAGSAYPINQPTSGIYPPSSSSKPGGHHEFPPPQLQPIYNTIGGSSFYPDLATLQPEPHQTTPGGHVKSEIWPSNHHAQGAGPTWSAAPHASWEAHQAKPPTTTSAEDHHIAAKTTKTTTQAGGYADSSSMLLHLGLNTRPQMSHHGKPAPWSGNQDHVVTSTRGGHLVNGASPPHGSSTIEEEGSTPANGYSNNGYEEGDTVSSMWQEMQNMQDIFQ